MKILKKAVVRRKAGVIGAMKFLPEDDEDIWYLYNILSVNDLITLKIHRKISITSANGTKISKSMYVMATLKVLKIDFVYDSNGTDLSIHTKNVTENEYIGMGQMQNVGVSLCYPITIFKKAWDRMHFQYVDEAVEASRSSEIVAMLMEEGCANLYMIKNNFCIHRGNYTKSLPGKKLAGGEFFKKSMDTYYQKCWEAVMNTFDIATVKCFVIGGPGVTREVFYKWLKDEKSQEKDMGFLKKLMNSFLVIKTSTVHRNALDEVLLDPAVQAHMTDTKAWQEAKKLDEFFEVMRTNENQAVYGVLEVKLAHELRAIKDLLITDELFRSTNFKQRQKFIKLVDDVKNLGGNVYFFSNMHSSGVKLHEMTGIAAIQRYEIDIDNMEDDQARIEREENRNSNTVDDKTAGIDNSDDESQVDMTEDADEYDNQVPISKNEQHLL